MASSEIGSEIDGVQVDMALEKQPRDLSVAGNRKWSGTLGADLEHV